MCVAALASELLEAPGANVPCFIDTTLVEFEGGGYVRPILLGPLADLLAEQRLTGGGRNGGGGSRGGSSGNIVLEVKIKKVGAPGGVRKGAGAIRHAPVRPVPSGRG